MGAPNPGMFASTTDEWPTPPRLFAALDAEFRFSLDVCASASNAKCARYFTREADGLAQDWPGACWMNPPYGVEIGKWVAKAQRESRRSVVVCLVPARTDTGWWHDHVMRAAEVRFIRGRLSFGGVRQEERRAASGAHNAPFPSVVAVFRPGSSGPPVCSAITRDGIPCDELTLFGLAAS